MARTEQEIATVQQLLCNQLGMLTASYEYQKASIIAEFKQLDEELAAARAEDARKTPEALRRELDELKMVRERTKPNEQASDR
jgi:hypothetical protein